MFRIPAKTKGFALGLTYVPISWLLRAISLGVERPKREADHTPASTAEVKNFRFMVPCVVLLQDHPTCFGYFPYPSSGVQ
jgi:hypothetical protein